MEPIIFVGEEANVPFTMRMAKVEEWNFYRLCTSSSMDQTLSSSMMDVDGFQEPYVLKTLVELSGGAVFL